MFTDLVVGTKGNIGSWSAVTYYKREEKLIQKHVSVGSRLFSVKSPLFNVNYVIMKDCSEGEKLQSLLDDLSVSEEDILNFLDEVVIKNISSMDLKKHIERVREESFKQGEKHIKLKFKQLISI